MKKTLIFSTTLAALLNLWQFFSSYQQREAAFAPVWTLPNAPIAAQTTSTPAAAQPASTASQTTTATSSVSDATSSTITSISGRLGAAGLSATYAQLYLRVQAGTGTPWQLLAAVHKIETGQRGNTTVTSYAGAQGPMQFMPATFRAYASDGNGDGSAVITNVDDAVTTAGRYLAAGGAARGDYRDALYNYNHSWSYVNKVMDLAHQLGL